MGDATATHKAATHLVMSNEILSDLWPGMPQRERNDRPFTGLNRADRRRLARDTRRHKKHLATSPRRRNG